MLESSPVPESSSKSISPPPGPRRRRYGSVSVPLLELVEGVLELALLDLELSLQLRVGLAFDPALDRLGPLAEPLHVCSETRQLVADVFEHATHASDPLVLSA